MNNTVKGAIYVALGASSYGVLATAVKYANNQGFGTAGMIFSQYLFGALVLSVLSIFLSKKSPQRSENLSLSKYPKLKLAFFGTSLGLTSSFYYLSLQYVPVSVAIILLMQTIWMGVALEFLVAPQLTGPKKIVGALVAIFGTVLAAKIFEADVAFNYIGIGFGLLAAVSYTAAMYTSNSVSLELPLFKRSKYLVLGGFLVVLLFWNFQIVEEVSWNVFWKWGIFLGAFGTIIPPILFNKGFPMIGTGLGSIISALEIPVSVFSAYLILGEDVSLLQWLGIMIILFSVVLINLKKVLKAR